MSEYQYYEFQTIDRPLTERQIDELRSYSSRARITSTSFINEYHWGDFKGDEDIWMQKYFDVFTYFACWGTRILKIALPSRLLRLKTLRPFQAGDCFEAYEKNGRTVITFRSEDEEHGDWEDDSCTLAPLVPTRSQLARGDLRALYIGWLLCVQSGEVDDDELEPPVPPGLAGCSGYIHALAEFLRIDSNLLCVAAETSAALPSQMGSKDILTWVEKLPLKVKDRALADLITGNDLSAATELLQRFNAEQQQDAQIASPTARLRTAGYLLQAARRNAAEQEKRAAERRAEEKARREKQAAAARHKHLESLVGREDELWDKAEKLISLTQPKAYDLALQILVDLRDLCERQNMQSIFESRLGALVNIHARKVRFIERLHASGI